MIREGLRNLAAGANPIVMKKGMAKAVEAAVGAIKEQSQKVNGTADIARVGTVSSGDETIGKLIAEAVRRECDVSGRGDVQPGFSDVAQRPRCGERQADDTSVEHGRYQRRIEVF